MAINIEHRWCYTCRKSVKSERHSVNHILHFLISLCTFGIWIPVWIVLAALRRFHCSECGSPTAKLPLGGRTARDADEYRLDQRKQDNRNAVLIVGSLLVIPIVVLVCEGAMRDPTGPAEPAARSATP